MQNIVESHIILAEKTNLTFNPYNIKDEDFSYNDGKPTSLITYAGLAWYTVIKGLSKNLTRHPNDVNIILDAFRDIALKEYKKYEHQRYVKNLIMSVPEDNKKNN